LFRHVTFSFRLWSSANRQLLVKFDVRPHCVTGVAHLDNRFFIVADQSDHVKVIDDSPPYASLQSIVVRGLQRPTDVAVCRLTRRLFVADYGGKCIWPIDVDKTAAAGDDTDENDCRETASIASVKLSEVIWTAYRPWSMSATSGRLVVVPENESTLYVYRCSGNSATVLLQSLRLPSYMVARHAVESPAGQGSYFVAHTGRGLWNELDQVTEINGKGQVVRLYAGRRGAGEQQLDRPTHLALLDQSTGGGVLVADYRNRRVVRLTDRLTFNRIEACYGEYEDGSTIEDDDCGPSRLCHVHLGDKLFVGFWNGGLGMYGPSAI
jgi:hypothetical protein